ncbi:MAG: acetamidase/formamidase family protein [Planctomycetota bacterium]
MKTQGTDILYFKIGPQAAPTLRVDQGEDFRVITQMNAGPWLKDHPDGAALAAKIRDGNPAGGCIFVSGANPGDMLAVTIKSITLGPVGYTQFGGSTGAMPAWFGSSGVGRHAKVVAIRDGCVEWSPALKLSARPMLGFVGTAPRHETIRNAWGGPWGGNLDAPEVCAGATLFLPVEIAGALLMVGDMHALQGDGEICGAGGIETGGETVLNCRVMPRPKSFSWPRVIDDTHIMVLASGKPAEDAFRCGLEALILWLEEEYRMARGEAFLLLG